MHGNYNLWPSWRQRGHELPRLRSPSPRKVNPECSERKIASLLSKQLHFAVNLQLIFRGQVVEWHHFLWLCRLLCHFLPMHLLWLMTICRERHFSCALILAGALKSAETVLGSSFLEQHQVIDRNFWSPLDCQHIVSPTVCFDRLFHFYYYNR